MTEAPVDLDKRRGMATHEGQCTFRRQLVTYVREDYSRLGDQETETETP